MLKVVKSQVVGLKLTCFSLYFIDHFLNVLLKSCVFKNNSF